ncbi:MAG TPA: hypothetical protein VFE13_09710 [Caulobacteraceae bacterium]|jgi:hypothetical protein|nr:hypothetical protein [Caulobacteraceae bacterium]
MDWGRGIAAAVAGAVLAVGGGPARAQPEAIGAGAPLIARGAEVSQEQENTAAGRPVVLFHYVHIDAACGPKAMGLVVATPPTHGTLRIEDGEERPRLADGPLFPPSDPRAHCANRLVPTRDGVYLPAPGFTGHDTMTVQFTEDGASFSDTIDVAVW